MPLLNYPQKNKKIILALGPESAGNFSVCFLGKIFFSENFGDLLDEKNYKNFQKSVLNFLEKNKKKNKIKPDIILTDLHPLYKTTIWGKELAKKFKAQHIQIQHHLAHIFSCYGEQLLKKQNSLRVTRYALRDFIGLACDGTGYGLDGKIWGGEIFKISNLFPISNKTPNPKSQIIRIGHLENQIMIGGDLAIKEPARMLISILDKIKNQKLVPSEVEGSKIKMTNQNFSQRLTSLWLAKFKKNFIYHYIKKYYTKNQFELLYNQLQQNFNCVETSGTGRILDAVSILLGFCKNERNYKHEPINLLEKNSSKPYTNIKPQIEILKNNPISNFQFPIFNEFSMIKFSKNNYILNTTFLFEYLIKNLHRDKKRLAATSQLYIAQGLYEIIKKLQAKKLQAVFAGGLANNKIISNYLKSKDVYINKKIPCGDASLSFGQIAYCIFNDLDIK
ncbi:hypothetical protein HY750_03285 [Candidatus Kuenenbacteria bacterium]|nr:hypothetical protein [Candidatus Kuenenbacteria bacterium]